MTVFLKGEIAIAIAPPASESPPEALKDTGQGKVAKSTSQPLREAQGVPERASENTSAREEKEQNPKFELVGNPVYNPYYSERKSGKRIADFTPATHEEKARTKYRRIRAFDKRAEVVRDLVRKGQTGVEAVVYGPKYWTQRKKTSKRTPGPRKRSKATTRAHGACAKKIPGR